MKDYDQQQIRDFYDPHPINFGTQLCYPPLNIVTVARALNGHSVSVYEAEGRLAAALEEGGRLRVDMEEGYIELHVTYKGLQYNAGHTFKLIKFR